MLKKWLKKRRKSSSKKPDGGFEASVSGSSAATTPSRKQKQKSGSRLLKRSSGKSENAKARSPSRKSNYRNIEKEESRISYSPPIVTAIVREVKATKEKPRSPFTSKRELIVSPPITSDSSSKARMAEISVTTTNNTIKNENKQKEKKEVPLIKIKPIQGPPDHPRTSIFKASSAEQKKEAPPPPAAEMLARDMSLLGVGSLASLPSLDTVLFAHEEGGEEKDPVTTNKKDSLAPEPDSPPTIIEAVLPTSLGADETGLVAQNDVVKPPKGDEFLTGAKPQSGTGSSKLQTWLNEVKRSIDNSQKQLVGPDLDRYHVAGDESIVEEKSEKDVVVVVRKSEKDVVVVTDDDHEAMLDDHEAMLDDHEALLDDHEALMESQNKIEQSLRETIQKSKAQMTTSPKGILKIKNVEKGTIRDEEDVTEESSGESSEPVSDSSSGAERTVELRRAMEMRPIKVFSKSRRQRLRESFSTDDEATSTASPSSSGSELAYETLQQLNPTVSRDETRCDTQKPQNGVQFLYSQMCDIGGIMEDYEKDLCEAEMDMDDAMSITDVSIASRSTISKDSFMAHQGGWMCFGGL